MYNDIIHSAYYILYVHRADSLSPTGCIKTLGNGSVDNVLAVSILGEIPLSGGGESLFVRASWKTP